MNIFIHTLLLYLVLEFQSKKVSAKLTKADSNEHSPKEDLDDDVPSYHSRVLENNRDLEREDTSGGNGMIVFYITEHSYGKYLNLFINHLKSIFDDFF